MKARRSPRVRNGHVCKDKWETLSGDFKKTYDYMTKIGHNELMSPQDQTFVVSI